LQEKKNRTVSTKGIDGMREKRKAVVGTVIWRKGEGVMAPPDLELLRCKKIKKKKFRRQNTTPKG